MLFANVVIVEMYKIGLLTAYNTNGDYSLGMLCDSNMSDASLVFPLRLVEFSFHRGGYE